MMVSPEKNKKVGRRHVRAPLALYINKIIGDEPHLALGRDISPGGIFIYKLLEPQARVDGDEVGLEFKLPCASDIIWATGKIVREETDGRGTGIRFVRIAEHDRKLISDYVARYGEQTA